MTVPFEWILIWYGVGSIVTFLVYAADKHKARRGRWRVAEFLLHLLAAAGGVPGALLAQHLLRHKNRKLGFQLLTWLIVLAHAAFLLLLTRPWR